VSKLPYKTVPFRIIRIFLDDLRNITLGFIVEGVMWSTFDTLGGYVDFLICHDNKTTFKIFLEG